MKKLKIERYVLTSHALERILERKISSFELDDLIKNYNGYVVQGEKYILYKNLRHRKDNRSAAVILEKSEGTWLVITVMINFQVN